MIQIKPEALQKVCYSRSLKRCTELALLLNTKAAEYKVESYDAFHEFLGQVVHESGQFAYKSEIMNYSADRLAVIWPNTFSRTKTKPYLPNQLAFKYQKKPVDLAIFKYGSQYGNRPGTMDGWDLRGGGYIGLTFREVWSKYAVYKKMDVVKCAEWVRTTDEGAMDSAFWFFYVYKNLGPLAIADDDRLITRRINGGLINFADRVKYTELAEKHIN